MDFTYRSREEIFDEFFPDAPAYRWGQIERALFLPDLKDWDNLPAVPDVMKQTLKKSAPWVSYANARVYSGANNDTFKAALKMQDGYEIETVLMKNARGFWTVCVSSQIGCAMRCGFCATGKMGLKRSLHSDEIIDQYRFWLYFLNTKPELPQKISNAVFMGMGEPLANYQNMKTAIGVWLKYAGLGKTRVTVSTVGMIPVLDKLLEDETWPDVRLAISLHSADIVTRKEIMPSSYDDFLEKLKDWAIRYLKKFGNERHHLTFEYVMLSGINDTDKHAAVLAKFVNKIGKVKVNLIPYNLTGSPYARSSDKRIREFLSLLEKRGVVCTIRKSMGEDIAAACGQLIRLSGRL